MNKKKSGIIATLMAGALLVTGTLAWRDASQHKTNKFTTTSVEHNVVLVENFEEVNNWRKNQAVTKEVAVRNGQESDNPELYIYEDAYVRLQFKEFMEIKDKTYEFSEKRYMIDTDGNFYRFATEEAAIEFLATLGEDAPADGRIESVQGLFDKDAEGNDTPFFYIATQQADKNGQYGKFIVVGETKGAGESLVEGQANNYDESLNNHNKVTGNHDGSGDYDNLEDNYATHKWGANANMSQDGNPFIEYVKWTFGNDVITIDEWNGQPVAKWILDTSSDEGWAYWGEALVHGTDATTTPQSLTANILEKVTLIEQPYGEAEYLIHVNMDAVNLNDLKLWDDAPVKITNAHQGKDEITLSRKALKESIELTQKYDLENVHTQLSLALQETLARAEEVYGNAEVSLERLNSMKEELDAALEAFKNDPISVAKVELNASIMRAKGVDLTRRTTTSKKELYDVYTEVTPLITDTTASLDAVVQGVEQLNAAIDGIQTSNGIKIENNKIETFAEHTWTVLNYDETEGTALIGSQVLSKKTLSDFGYPTSYGTIGYAKGTTYVPYVESTLYNIDRAFFETFVLNDENYNAVLPVSIEQEVFLGTSWDKRSDKPTIIDEDGEKTSFTFSVSDKNYYNLSDEQFKSTGSFWLRSPGGTNERAASMWSSLSSSGTVESLFAVRQGLFVEVYDDTLFMLPK